MATLPMTLAQSSSVSTSAGNLIAATSGIMAVTTSTVTTDSTTMSTIPSVGFLDQQSHGVSSSRVTNREDFATTNVGAYPWGLPPGYSPPYETTSDVITTSAETYPQQGYNPLYEATTAPTTSNVGPYPWDLPSGYNPLYQAHATSVIAPTVTAGEVSWQDLNNDVNNLDNSIGQLGRNLENCIGQLGINLDGMGRNLENSFSQLNQNMGVQSEMMNAWLRWFQTGSATHVANNSQNEGNRSRAMEQGQSSQVNQVQARQVEQVQARPATTIQVPNRQQQTVPNRQNPNHSRRATHDTSNQLLAQLNSGNPVTRQGQPNQFHHAPNQSSFGNLSQPNPVSSIPTHAGFGQPSRIQHQPNLIPHGPAQPNVIPHVPNRHTHALQPIVSQPAWPTQFGNSTYQGQATHFVGQQGPTQQNHGINHDPIIHQANGGPEIYWQPNQHPQVQPRHAGLDDQNRPVFFNEVQNLVRGMVGDFRPHVDRPTYTKPYPPHVDQVPFPYRYRVPAFHLFSGDAYQSTIEHIGRFISQCGEANSEENRMQLFSNSLTGSAFSWFVNLPPNSIQTWRDLERAFHDRFYKAEQNIPVAELAKSFQTATETAQEYIGRFKLLRTRCKAQLAESEFVEMALAGLGFEFRKKFEGLTFRDLYELESRVVRYDAILREEAHKRLASKGTYYTSQAVGTAHIEEWSSDEDMTEINSAEFTIKQPFVCKALDKTESVAQSLHNTKKAPPRTYTFDIRKADLIFDQLLAAKLIKLSFRHVLPSVEQLKGKYFVNFIILGDIQLIIVLFFVMSYRI